jgi:hypothetical protein
MQEQRFVDAYRLQGDAALAEGQSTGGESHLEVAGGGEDHGRLDDVIDQPVLGMHRVEFPLPDQSPLSQRHGGAE